MRDVRDDSGATAIEYGLIAALVAIAISSGASAVGGKLYATFYTVRTHLNVG